MLNRRHFLSLAALAGAAAVGPVFGQARRRLGVQLFSVPRLLADDFKGTLSWLAGLGYSEVEFFGPYDFSAPENIAFMKSLEPVLGFSGGGFFGRSPQETRRILDELHLAAPSLHTDLDTLQTRMGPLADTARTIGASYVVLPAIPEEKRKTLDDYKRMADTFNSIGASAEKHGVEFVYHNHGYGWRALEGVIPVPLLLEHTDPKRVLLEMDLFWTTAAGVDPVQLLRKHPHRYRMMHVKDMKELRHFEHGDGVNEMLALASDMTSAGDGVLDLKAIVAQAKKSGVEHFFIEQDRAANPQVDMRRSADYMLKLV